MFKIRSRRNRAGLSPAVRRRLLCVAAAMIALPFVPAFRLQAQKDVFKPPVPVTYTEKYEIFGAANFMNGQAGQSLPKRYNMGGGEAMATYWLTPKYGVVGDVRFVIGSTPVLPGGQATTPRVQTRPYVSQTVAMGGVQYHWIGNHYAGVNFHALAGATVGDFDHSNPGLSAGSFASATGLYSNRTSFMGTVGPSFDFNRSAHIAVRLSPEIVFEHFGDELREFVSVSGGIVYRFGDR